MSNPTSPQGRLRKFGMGSVYDECELRAVTKILEECIREGRGISMGSPEVPEFEKKVQDYLGVKNAFAISSCGAGLDIATRVIGITPGDEVITTAVTYQATAVCVLAVGGRPVAADVDPGTVNMDPEDVKRKITPRTKAIYPMHYGGCPVDMDPILEMAEENDLYVVEDAAGAIGAEYEGNKIGTLGDITVFSLQTSKIITSGEGGIITTNDDELAEKIRGMRSFYVTKRRGWENSMVPHPLSKDVVDIGYNYRMTPFQAALGMCQLEKLDSLIAKRTRIAKHYSQELEGVEGIERTQVFPPDCRHSLYFYTLLFDESKVGIHRNELLRRLNQLYGIDSITGYPIWYRYSVFQERGYKWEQCPVAEILLDLKLFTLPIHPAYTQDEMNYVTASVKKVLREAREEFTSLVG